MSAGIVRIVTDASFARDVLERGRLILVAFGAPWCGPCGLMSPGLRALAAQQRDRLIVAKLDVDANPATADRYGVETYPTCILFRAGEEAARLDGYMPLRKLEAALRPHLDAA
ncbi:MAG TPA: thioredoxin domain-containing protein [Allosphingosinicella sp.]|nr:thioredoxin domain-containing protein [Allosphingosinicella sp.]